MRKVSTSLTWTELNALLRRLRSETEVRDLYQAQTAAGANARWRKRIWGRFSQLRKERERRELAGGGPYRGPRRKKEAA